MQTLAKILSSASTIAKILFVVATVLVLIATSVAMISPEVAMNTKKYWIPIALATLGVVASWNRKSPQ